jgi:uncharacterized membrane protein YdfJ with MMPL/SSD domain
VQDVEITSAVVLLLVSLVVGLYFGRLRSVPLMAVPVLIAAVIAMGFAGVAFGSVNATTAFLGGIIVGNGINYPILLLARYDEERRRLRPVDEALSTAVVTTARATGLAAFAASLAYGSLMITRFRGFSEFGAIAALGMVLCWVATQTMLPSLVWALDRPRDGRPAARPAPRRANFGRPFAIAVEGAPVVLVVAGLLLTVGTIAALPRWLADPYEYDFRKLHRVVPVGAETSPELDKIFGRALSPAVVLAASREQAAEVKEALLAQAAYLDPDPVAHAVTLDDLLPGTPAEQRRKLALIGEIRQLLAPRRLRGLPEPQRRALAAWRPPPGLHVLTVDDLPAIARMPFTELDGHFGQVVFVYPPGHGFSTWDGRDLLWLARAIGSVPLHDGAIVHASGRAVTFASMLRAIARDGPRATAASLLGVALLALGLLGRRGAPPVLGALVAGVLWMLGIAATLDVKLNFLNFIALPITFGIGVDYSANVVLRYRREGGGSFPAVLRSTGGAVVLNSCTTIIGYGALLAAHNRALRSFGSLAILGELACLAAAVLLLPAIGVLRDRGGRVRAPSTSPLTE